MRPAAGSSRSNLARRGLDIAIVVALLLVAALTHGEVFHATSGYRAALGGVALGVTVALGCAWFRLGAQTAFLAVVVAYLLGAGPLALPDRALWGVLPTPAVLSEALLGAVSSWKDLLTVQVPVPEGSSTLLMPLLAALVCSFLATSFALSLKHQVLALIPTTGLLLTGVYWGSQRAPFGIAIGLAVALLSWWWAVRALGGKRGAEIASILRLPDRGAVPKRHGLTGAVLLLGLAVAAGLASPLLLPAEGARVVLRDSVEPTLDIQQYASPVVSYRYWRTSGADTELFTMEGEPGARIRLATLDSYNGTVFRVSSGLAETSFAKVGPRFTDVAPPGQLSELEVQISGYAGNWVIGGGQVNSLEYSGPRSQELQDSLYYSEGLGTMLSTVGLVAGDSYRVTAVNTAEVPDSLIQDRALQQVPMPVDTNVPEAVSVKAQQLTQGASSGFEQVRALQLKLSSQGYYSDGTDGLSRSGHRADRLEQFLTNEYMIGDDDQFAPAMVLMLRSLGIPSRLVMGFKPENTANQPVRVTGKDVSLWVEVPFEGVGWVPFDPTPPKDQTIRTQVPVPQPQQQPQVLQPPEPPEKPAEMPPEELSEVDDPREDPVDPNTWWVRALQITAGVLALLTPLLLLVAFKALRCRRRRKHGSPEVRSVGAWAELVDRARDLGVRVATGAPRNRQAEMIETQVWGAEPIGTQFRDPEVSRSQLQSLSERLDAVVFGPAGVPVEVSESIWHDLSSVIRRMRATLGWRRRVGAALSLRTLRSQWITAEPPAKPAGDPPGQEDLGSESGSRAGE